MSGHASVFGGLSGLDTASVFQPPELLASSPSCAPDAAEAFLDSERLWRRELRANGAARRGRLAIVGAGVLGLTIAELAVTLGYDVTIYHDLPLLAATSPYAAGLIEPVAPPESPEGQRIVLAAFEHSYKAYAAVLRDQPREIINLRCVTGYRRQPVDPPAWADTVDGYELLSAAELPPRLGVSWAERFVTFVVDPPAWITWTAAKLVEGGARFYLRHIESPSVLAGCFDAVVNATGIGAATFVGDPQLYRCEGHVITVARPADFHEVVFDWDYPGESDDDPIDFRYAIARTTDVMLGGTLHEGRSITDGEPMLEPGMAERLLAAVTDLVPELSGPVWTYVAASRPMRATPRLEGRTRSRHPARALLRHRRLGLDARPRPRPEHYRTACRARPSSPAEALNPLNPGLDHRMHTELAHHHIYWPPRNRHARSANLVLRPNETAQLLRAAKKITTDAETDMFQFREQVEHAAATAPRRLIAAVEDVKRGRAPSGTLLITGVPTAPRAAPDGATWSGLIESVRAIIDGVVGELLAASGNVHLLTAAKLPTRFQSRRSRQQLADGALVNGPSEWTTIGGQGSGDDIAPIHTLGIHELISALAPCDVARLWEPLWMIETSGGEVGPTSIISGYMNNPTIRFDSNSMAGITSDANALIWTVARLYEKHRSTYVLRAGQVLLLDHRRVIHDGSASRRSTGSQLVAALAA